MKTADVKFSTVLRSGNLLRIMTLPLRKIYPTASKAAGSSGNNAATGPRNSRAKKSRLVFQVAIALVACVCLVWTLWLILLNVAPNETINRVMKTETFDYGSFWLMVDPPKAMMVAATIGLFVVAIGYLSVLVAMLPFKRKHKYAAPVHRGSHVLVEKVGKVLNDAAEDRTGSKVTSSAAKLVVSLTHEESLARKRIVRCSSSSSSWSSLNYTNSRYQLCRNY